MNTHWVDEVLKIVCLIKSHYIHLLVDRCGFVGENEPRVIIPSKVDGSKKGEGVYLHEYSNEKELHLNLVKFLHHIFFKYYF